MKENSKRFSSYTFTLHKDEKAVIFIVDQIQVNPYENLVSVRYLLIRILDSNALVSNKQSVTYLLHGG